MKTKLTLSMDLQKVKELKKNAIDAGITLSDYLAAAGTITPIPQILEYQNSNSTAGSVTPKDNINIIVSKIDKI